MDTTPTTVVEILDLSLNLVSPIKNFVPLNKSGTILQYSKELSDYGKCTFRVSAYDNIFTTYGDVLVPHRYHIRVRRGAYVVWQGAIIDNPKRNQLYVEVVAAEYEYYLSKKLIHRTSPDPINNAPNIFRIFNSGTMDAAVTAIMNETIADYKASDHVLSNMTIGTIENPNFPPGMISDFIVNGSPETLTGPWQFGTGLTADSPGPTLQFDFHNMLYVLKSLGVYSYADFEITPDLVFNFKRFLGNNLLNNLKFVFGKQGNIYDYNLPRKGERQTNRLIGIATDINGVILNNSQDDSASIDTYGLMEDVAAYSDVKTQAILDNRITAELRLISKPDETNAIIYLNENGYPLGQYDIGDIVTIKVTNLGIDFDEVRRIVGITVILNETGRETTAVQTNIPLDWQYNPNP